MHKPNAFDRGYLRLVAFCRRRHVKFPSPEFKRLWRAWGAWARRNKWIWRLGVVLGRDWWVIR